MLNNQRRERVETKIYLLNIEWKDTSKKKAKLHQMQDIVYQSLAREDTNHTLSKKAKNEANCENESHRDGFLIQATSRLDWNGTAVCVAASSRDFTHKGVP